MSTAGLARNTNYLNNQILSAMQVMNNLSLICEEAYTSKPTIIKQTNVDTTIFKTILQEAEVPNRNGRIYTKKAIDEALNRPVILERLQHKTWYGECGEMDRQQL